MGPSPTHATQASTHRTHAEGERLVRRRKRAKRAGSWRKKLQKQQHRGLHVPTVSGDMNLYKRSDAAGTKRPSSRLRTITTNFREQAASKKEGR